MAYHVEVRRSIQHGRVFNLDEAELRRVVLEPWAVGAPLRIGDQVWKPHNSRLLILKGPELASVDLQYGQGWKHAQRTAKDVTADVLGAAMLVNATAVAVLAPNERAAEDASARIEELGFHPVEWPPVREWIVARTGDADPAPAPGVAGVLLVCDGELPAWWLLDAGLAVGALGSRAVMIADDAWLAPQELLGLEILRLGSGSESSLDPLAQRLKRAADEAVGIG